MQKFKLTVERILELEEALKSVQSSTKLPIGLVFDLATVRESIYKHVKNYAASRKALEERFQKNEIIHGPDGKEQKMMIIPMDKKTEYFKEIESLNLKEIEIESCSFKMKDFGFDVKNKQLNPYDLPASFIFKMKPLIHEK